MSILATELILYGSANISTNDTATEGGAIDATRRPVLALQVSTNTVLHYVSSAADTRQVTTILRDATGASVTETITLNGTTVVPGSNTAERILSSNASATNGSNTITVQDSLNSITFATVPPNETGVFIEGQNQASSTSPVTRYWKSFWKNTDATLTLTSSTVTLTADPSGVTQIGLAPSVGDSATIANRMTAPAAVSFSGTAVALSVPGGGNLAAGSAIGMWVKQTLPSNQVALKSSYTTQLQGNST